MPMRHISPQMLRSAQAYAAAERSDPFALARALTHLRSGVASIDATYEAEWDVDSFGRAVWRNVKRP